jgi:hypothetical protein
MSTHKIVREYRDWQIKDLSELRSWLFRQKWKEHWEKNKQAEQEFDKKILKIEAELALRTEGTEGREKISREEVEKVTSRTLDGNYGIEKGVIG